MANSDTDLTARNKKYTLVSWKAQKDWQPISIVRGEGVYFWDEAGKRYLDWSSQSFNVNCGHNNQHIIRTIQEQAARLSVAGPAMATAPRARLGELLHELTPDGLTRSFFTLGGADAIENAMKIARLLTGRQKIMTRYRAYHGATFGAMSAGGDPRRLANEPGVPWIVRLHDPYAYRSPLYHGRSQAEGDQALVDQIAETIAFEGPDNIAALLLEGYSGASGIIQGGDTFWRGIQTLCEQHGILLIIDEVMSGFGRTGEWFGINHYPFVKPDMLVMAKGLTSGYQPLGAVTVHEKMVKQLDQQMFWGGLTLSSHPLACATAVANIEVIQQEKLVARARENGKVLRQGLVELAEKHPCIGDIRGVGLHFLLELVRNRETREPLSKFNQPLSDPMRQVAAALLESGLSTAVRWNWIFNTPPLIISKAEIEAGLTILDNALLKADMYYEGT